jgi:DNA-binding winged helix-turn-helix (wHTH) protein
VNRKPSAIPGVRDRISDVCLTTASPPRRRYRFAGFTLSPRGRLLLRGGRELPLIPRYFDLLVLLVERRGDAVHRREIFDAVWSDVVVSDSALTQAVRTIRRALGDDPREPQFIRTVSRHGYRFVCADIVEEPDDGPAVASSPVSPVPAAAPEDAREAALAVLLQEPNGREDEGDTRRDAAEVLHQMGTADALARLQGRRGHERARAHLRDSRWDVPGAAPVPLLGAPGGAKALAILFGLRLRRARRLAGERWFKAAVGGALAGLVSGVLGGTVLWLGPGSRMTPTVPIVLGLLGMAVGGAGAAGVGAGLAMAEVLVRSWRRVSLAILGALGGGLAGALSHLVAQWTVQGLFGRDMSPIGGSFEGLVMGGAIGLGYGLATPRPEGGMATPAGWARMRVALLTGLAGAIAALALAATGSYLGAMSLDFMARSFPGSQVSFEPLARLLGESAPGWLTRLAIGAGEGLAFGSGLAFGLTHRPRLER